MKKNEIDEIAEAYKECIIIGAIDPDAEKEEVIIDDKKLKEIKNAEKSKSKKGRRKND